MKKPSIRRTFALILALVMALALGACTTTSPTKPSGDTGATTLSGEKPFNTPTKISMVVGSHPSWTFDENWPAWKYFREATGATFAVTAIPNTEFETKLTLMMADKSSLPDLIYLDYKPKVDSYADSGALIAIDDYLDQMPNYTKFWNTISKEEREMRQMQRRSSDGKTYFPQNYGTDSRQSIHAWIYRKDIFEKNNLQVPETMEDLYNTAVALKKLYPKSYPLCIRAGLTNIDVIASEWKSNFTYKLYYDLKNKKWSYGMTEPVMRDIVEYLRKLHEQELIPPDYLTINSKTWEELMSTDRGFISPDYVVRVDFFNIPNRKENPDYTFAAMKPPRANTEAGQNLMNKFNVDPKGYVICNTGDKSRIKNAIKLVDWMYSDDAAQLLGWGKQGETYEVKNGKKQFIRPEDGDIEGKYGLFTYGTYLRVDPAAAIAVATDEQAKSVTLALDYTEKSYNPALWMAFSGEESKKRDSLNEAISSYTDEMLSKFLLSQEPMSNWDSFIKELNDLGVNDLVALYDNRYNELVK